MKLFCENVHSFRKKSYVVDARLNFKNLTRNATHCNNRDDLLHLSLTLKNSIFSEAYIQTNRTSDRAFIAKIISNSKYIKKKSSMVDARLSSKYAFLKSVVLLKYFF